MLFYLRLPQKTAVGVTEKGSKLVDNDDDDDDDDVDNNNDDYTFINKKRRTNCGRQEEPAILISRFLLRMCRMCIASIRLDFHEEWVECTKRFVITLVSTFYPAWAVHACFDHLSSETYAKAQRWSKSV